MTELTKIYYKLIFFTLLALGLGIFYIYLVGTYKTDKIYQNKCKCVIELDKK